MSLSNVQFGESVIVYRDNGELVAVAECVGVSQTRATIKGYGQFSLRGKQIGKHLLARQASAAELSEAASKIEAAIADAKRRREEELQRDYDALPESIKLARTLKFSCDNLDEKSVAEMPIDTLRAAVSWLDETFDTSNSNMKRRRRKK